MTCKLTFSAALASTAAALCFLAPTSSAQTGYYGTESELFLFDSENFNGLSIYVDVPVETLTYLNFNDRAESVDFTGPGWLLCKHANFEGPCIVVRQPIYDLDDFGLENEITSARPLSDRNPYPHGTIFGQDYYGDIVFYEVTSWGSLRELDPYDSYGYSYGDGYRMGSYGAYGLYGQYDPYNPYYDYDPNDWTGYRGPRNADIVLYRDSYYRGSAYGLNRDAWNLSTLYFNDEISSIEIRRGKWEICTDSNFGGRCQIFDASQTSLSNLRLNDNISSVRRIDGYRGQRHGQYQNHGHGYGGGGHRPGDRDHHNGGKHGGHGGHGGHNGGPVTIYEHSNYGGLYVPVSGDIANLSTLGLNDAASSIRIRSGTWEICEHPNYEGRCQIVDASTSALNGFRLNDNVSSIRQISGGRPGHGGGHNGGGQGNHGGGGHTGGNRPVHSDPKPAPDFKPVHSDPKPAPDFRPVHSDPKPTPTINPRSHDDHPRWGTKPSQPQTPVRQTADAKPRSHEDHPRWGTKPQKPQAQRPQPTARPAAPKPQPTFSTTPSRSQPKPPAVRSQPKPEPTVVQRPPKKPQAAPRPQPKPQPQYKAPPKPKYTPPPQPQAQKAAPKPKPVARPPTPQQNGPKKQDRNAKKYH